MLVRLLVALIAGMSVASAATPLSTYFARGRSFSPVHMVTDANGNVYIAGNTQLDVFLTKLDSDFREVYTVVWGGSGYEQVQGLAITPSGDIYVAGSTGSADFPIVDATQPALLGNTDGFVTKLSANGGFVFSTYLGGTDADNIAAIAVDQDGNAYVTGNTQSHDFPVTTGAFQTTFVPRNPFAVPVAAFAAKLTPTGRISYATYLNGTRTACSGGSACLPAIARSWGYAIAVDTTGAAYIAGSTNSLDFPVTPGAFNTSCACNYDAADVFVTKLNRTGSGLVFSTYLAAPSPLSKGSGEEVHDLAVDSTGNVYAAGTTRYETFPTTPGSLHPQPHLASTDVAVFAFKLAAGGDRLLYSTYLNDGDSASIAGLQVDAQGNLLLAGTSLATAIPATSGAPGNGAGFLAKLNPQGSAWNYVARVPAGSADRALALSASGDALVVGSSGFLSRSTTDGTGYKMPLIFGVANAAGVSISPLIAPLEIISIYGVGIGPAQDMGARLVNGAQVDSELGGTRVLINGTPAPLTFAGPNQINAAVPARQLPNENTVSLQITRDGQNIASINLLVREPLPEVFPTGEVILSSYIAAALNEDGSVNSRTNPAKANSIVSVFATGLGSMTPTLQDGAIVTNIAAAKLVTNVRVVVANDTRVAELLYAGQAPGLIAGAIQLNFRLPDIFGEVASFKVEAGASRSTQFGVYVQR